MKKIGIISDTHGFWDKAFKRYFSECDEIWHAGDIGHLNIIEKLKERASLKAGFGKIDNNNVVQYLYSMYLLVASLPIIFLANRAIKKDDSLVKSLDRLR